jgi:predicted protein tyrosine phosphatase
MMMRMRVLFICDQNQNMSKTAEEVFSGDFETRSAGLYENEVTKEQVEWADLIAVMTRDQEQELHKRFPKMQKRVVTLDIPDIYFYQQPELISELQNKAKLLGRI